jgi:hypothetical protein
MSLFKIRLFTTLIFLIFFLNNKAQNEFTVSGGLIKGVGGAISYSVGQIAYTTIVGTTGYMAQGVQVPNEFFIVTCYEKAKYRDLICLVYPNPTTNNIILKISDYDIENLFFELYDINGILLQKMKINTLDTNIDLTKYICGTYIFKITDKSKAVKIFKIIKNNQHER